MLKGSSGLFRVTCQLHCTCILEWPGKTHGRIYEEDFSEFSCLNNASLKNDPKLDRENFEQPVAILYHSCLSIIYLQLTEDLTQLFAKFLYNEAT